MVPQSTQQARHIAEPLCFPLKERYNVNSSTLDGRELSLRVQEPPMDDQEDAGGDVPVTAEGPALGAPPDVVPDVAPPAALPAPAPAGEPDRFVADALGRRYPVDEFGLRVCRSPRPLGTPLEIWNTLSAEKKKAFIAEHARALAGHVAPPALLARAPCDEAQHAA